MDAPRQGAGGEHESGMAEEYDIEVSRDFTDMRYV